MDSCAVRTQKRKTKKERKEWRGQGKRNSRRRQRNCLNRQGTPVVPKGKGVMP
jgi:hypothetical protein